ncbi:LysM peptidoglycan-binding domain-containing protein [Cellulomonas palmilytica]|uniref:LysM peptidoglycan-binding domain-containing protein n=1 Tax=Cellulomonas palmilytica TaxID=2608402 RepID=UPI001F1A3B33|nr:LysM peptidoglycan-binding domain-containing protein [Cellulomonas palmilytica]UJP38748.1 LysM peptidoglycan-binding domain-containing protein [Cellulomonas palmilytica]
MSAMVIGPEVFGSGRAGAGRPTARPGRAQRERTAAPAVGHRSGDVPLRLTRRGRAVVAALALAVSGVAFVLGSHAAAGADTGMTVERYVVRSGDTLWDIAAASRAEGESVQHQVRELVRLNGMSGTHVDAGQELVVPRG